MEIKENECFYTQKKRFYNLKMRYGHCKGKNNLCKKVCLACCGIRWTEGPSLLE